MKSFLAVAALVIVGVQMLCSNKNNDFDNLLSFSSRRLTALSKPTDPKVLKSKPLRGNKKNQGARALANRSDRAMGERKRKFDPKTVTAKETVGEVVGRHGSYFGSSKVVVVQAADNQYASVMKPLLDVNHEWANCMGYQYIINTWDKVANSCVYTEKVKVIHDVLHTVDENDWVIFLDADVKFQSRECTSLEAMLPTQSQINSQPCELIAMTSGHSVNSGILLVQKTPNMIRVVQRWLEIQYEKQVCRGPADQISLQEVILEELLGPSYGRKCIDLTERSILRADECFGRYIPQDQRSNGQFCLLDCVDFPLQCHGSCLRDRTCNKSTAIFDHHSLNHNLALKKKAKGATD